MLYQRMVAGYRQGFPHEPDLELAPTRHTPGSILLNWGQTLVDRGHIDDMMAFWCIIKLTE